MFILEGCTDSILRFGPDGSLETKNYDEKLTFLEASNKCWKNNGHLVVIRTEEDGEELYEKLSKQYPDGSKFWAGGSDALSKGTWVNLDNAEEFEYINWLPGRPTGGSENCMELVMQDGKLFANDVSCMEKRAYICETVKAN